MRFNLCVMLLVGAALVAAQAPAPAPAATPLPLPADPPATCTAEAMMTLTSSTSGCYKLLTHGDDSAECCVALAERYGANSTAPTANCFCVPEYWSELSALSKVNYVDWGGSLDKCNTLGYPIPYFKDGEGPCAGVSAEAAPEEASPAPEVLPMRTFSAWVAALGSDPWNAASFTFGILSAIGGCVMAWSFLFDAYTDVRSHMGAAKAAA